MLSILAVTNVKGQPNLSFSVKFKSVPLNTAISDGELLVLFGGWDTKNLISFWKNDNYDISDRYLLQQMQPLRVYDPKDNTSGAEMLLHIKSIHSPDSDSCSDSDS